MMRPSQGLPVVYLCRDPVDFRKGINGLAVLVEDVLCLDPFVVADVKARVFAAI